MIIKVRVARGRCSTAISHIGRSCRS